MCKNCEALQENIEQLRERLVLEMEANRQLTDLVESIENLKLDEPRKPPEEVKSLVAGLVEKLGG